MLIASSRPAFSASQKLSCQPPMRLTTWSVSRLSTPGWRSAYIWVIVDFPTPDGPFTWISRAIHRMLPTGTARESTVFRWSRSNGWIRCGRLDAG